MSTSITPPAMYHGRFGFRFGEPPATAAPHWVQKRAPGTRLARHSRQRPGSSGAPHDGQNRPSDSVPQLAHFMRQNTAHPPGAGRGWRAYVGDMSEPRKRVTSADTPSEPPPQPPVPIPDFRRIPGERTEDEKLLAR